MPDLIWGDTVRLSGSKFANHYAIAYLILSFLSFFGILYALLSCRRGYPTGDDAQLRMSAFKHRAKAMIFFLLAYGFQILNILLHEERKDVKEGYFFTYVFSDAWWQLGDLLVLVVFSRITYYQFPAWGSHATFEAAWRLWCMSCLTTLWALALYRWGVSTAHTIMTLNGASDSWLAGLYHKAAQLETGYHFLYMIMTTFIVSATIYYLGKRTSFRERFSTVEGQFFTVAILFWIKAIARAAIVLRYTLDEVNPPVYLKTAGEALYGLPTVAIFVLFNYLNLADPLLEAKSTVLREGRRAARRDLRRRRIDAGKGGPALPTPAQLLTEFEKQPLLYFSDDAQRSISSLTDNEVQTTLSAHIHDVLNLREKI